MLNLTPLNVANPVQSIEEKSINDKLNAVVHLRIQKRTGRSCLTFIEGIPESIDWKTLSKTLRKKFHCNCTVINHPKYGECIQMSGDHRDDLCKFFIENKVVEKDKNIKIHGF